MRAMGLDVGTKTIGVAVTDALGVTAQGVTTVRRVGPRKDVAAVVALAKEYEVDRVVVGLPLNLSGDEGPRAVACRAFGTTLGEASGLPIDYWDERLSTVAAERALLEGNVSRKKRRAVIDQIAATIILQGWLEAHPREASA